MLFLLYDDDWKYIWDVIYWKRKIMFACKVTVSLFLAHIQWIDLGMELLSLPHKQIIYTRCYRYVLIFSFFTGVVLFSKTIYELWMSESVCVNMWESWNINEKVLKIQFLFYAHLVSAIMEIMVHFYSHSFA